jgi:hypothetical protein
MLSVVLFSLMQCSFAEYVPQYTEYLQTGHAAWTATYSNDAVSKRLLDQQKNRSEFRRSFCEGGL